MSKPLSTRDQERIGLAQVQERYRTIRTLIWGATWLGGIFLGRDVVASLSGETTRLIFELSILADVKFALTVTLAGAAATWAVFERVIRHRKVEQMQGRIKELETRLDPNRSSSGLTPKGKTNPKDKRR